MRENQPNSHEFGYGNASRRCLSGLACSAPLEQRTALRGLVPDEPKLWPTARLMQLARNGIADVGRRAWKRTDGCHGFSRCTVSSHSAQPPSRLPIKGPSPRYSTQRMKASSNSPPSFIRWGLSWRFADSRIPPCRTWLVHPGPGEQLSSPRRYGGFFAERA